MTLCILCGHLNCTAYHKSDLYTYLHCPVCDLVFVEPSERLTPVEEMQRYEQHQNDPEDTRYRDFLSRLFEPMIEKLNSKSYGLDYGSGPGPTLHLMFQEAGHRVDTFDPFFDNNHSVFNNVYDFITSTETVEHFYNPGKEFNRIWKLLKPGGHLGIMTLLHPKTKPFTEWNYILDDTHVALYSKKTFHWLAKNLDAGLTFYGDRVIILEKSL